MQVTAIDLGTSNTCVVDCYTKNTQDKHGLDNMVLEVQRPEAWHNPSLGGSVPTLVLYQNEQPLVIGAAAELEFGEAGEQERKQYALRSQFKPDIAVNAQAKVWMQDFLRLLRERITIKDGEQSFLLVGIPSQAENHYQQILRQCLNATNFNNAMFLREPVGALLHYIAKKALPPSQAAKGVLTIDFGGGTCDLAMLRRTDVVRRHGDMLYGGRLFDDLIYQILLERNADLEQSLQAENNAYYVHFVACRRAKEEFSEAMAKDKKQAFTVRVRWSYFDGAKVSQKSAYIENLTWEEFLIKAGSYVATPALLKLLSAHKDRAELSSRGQGLLAGKQVDLISWFEDILLQTLAPSNAEHVPYIPLVLLTGGSSSWIFVKDIVQQNMGENVKILMGDEPYADIAKGLAQYYVLSEHLSQGRNYLLENLSSFMEERIRKQAIMQTMNNSMQNLIQELNDFLRQVVIMPTYRIYKEQGGSIAKLMQDMGNALRDEDVRIRNLVKDATASMGQNMADACRTELMQWFNTAGIPVLPDKLAQNWLGSELDSFVIYLADDLAEATLMDKRNTAQMATLIAAPSLAVLATAGAPLTALTLGIGGALLMKVFKVDSILVEKALHIPVPSLIRKRIFNDQRLEKLCEEQLESFNKQCTERMLKAWENIQEKVLKDAEYVAREEIAALDILNITPA